MVSVVASTDSLKGKPHWRRTEQVYAVLDASPPEATYDRLIEYVRIQTGKGCSRKLISKWKKLTIQDRVYPPSSPNPKSETVPQEIFLASEVRVNTEEIPVKDEPLVTETHSSIENTLDNNPAEVEESKNPQFIFEHEDEQLPNRAVSPKPSIDSPQEHLTEKAEPKAKNSHPIQEKVLQVAKNTWSYVAATAIVIGLAGCGWLFSKDNSQPVIAQTTTVTQTAPKPRPQKLEPRTIKIDLTLTHPQDLKVKPGDEVTQGTILSDPAGIREAVRTLERQRLLSQKKQLQLSLKKLDLPIPPITNPEPISKLSKFPPVSYQQEEANIALKQQELAETEKAIANQQEKIRQLSELLITTQAQDFNNNLTETEVQGKVKFSQLPTNNSNVARKGNSSNKPILNNSKQANASLKQNSKFPMEIASNTIPNPKPTANNQNLKIIIEHEQAILSQLQAARDKAQLQLDIAKSKLISAKEKRAHAEYQRYVEDTKRAIAIQQQQIELERQRSIRAGQLQEREYSKAQIEAKIQEIDNAINNLSTVKAPYAGKIKKVKWTGQDNHHLTVQLTLDVDDGSEKPTVTSQQ